MYGGQGRKQRVRVGVTITRIIHTPVLSDVSVSTAASVSGSGSGNADALAVLSVSGSGGSNTALLVVPASDDIDKHARSEK